MDAPLSPRTRDALDAARAEAARLGHDAVGAEHLLLGLLRVGGAPVRRLRALGVRVRALKESAEAVEGAADLDAVVEAATEAAGSAAFDPEHLLVGLVRAGGPTAEALAEHGVTEATLAGPTAEVVREPAAPYTPDPEAARERARAAANRLSLVFDADVVTEGEVAEVLLALSELYRALGGDGLIVVESGVADLDAEREAPC